MRDGDGGDHDGKEQAKQNGLHSGISRAFGIFLADAPRDEGGSRHAEADGDTEDHGQQRFGQTDGGDGIGAEAETKKTSTIPKRLSIAISRIMGMASSTMPRRRSPSVKS